MSPFHPPSYTLFPSYSTIIDPLNSWITRFIIPFSYTHTRFTFPFSISKHFPFLNTFNSSYSLTLITWPFEFTSLKYPLIPSIGTWQRKPLFISPNHFPSYIFFPFLSNFTITDPMNSIITRFITFISNTQYWTIRSFSSKQYPFPFFLFPEYSPTYLFFPFSSYSVISFPLNTWRTRINRPLSYKQYFLVLPLKQVPFPFLTNPLFMSPPYSPSYTFVLFSSYSIIIEPLNSCITCFTSPFSYTHTRFTFPFSISKHFPFLNRFNSSYSLTLINWPEESTSLKYPLIPSIGSWQENPLLMSPNHFPSYTFFPFLSYSTISDPFISTTTHFIASFSYKQPLFAFPFPSNS